MVVTCLILPSLGIPHRYIFLPRIFRHFHFTKSSSLVFFICTHAPFFSFANWGPLFGFGCCGFPPLFLLLSFSLVFSFSLALFVYRGWALGLWGRVYLPCWAQTSISPYFLLVVTCLTFFKLRVSIFPLKQSIGGVKWWYLIWFAHHINIFKHKK